MATNRATEAEELGLFHPPDQKVDGAGAEGRSRESHIVLDHAGRFWHEGAPVEHPRLLRALRSWISRHPENGRPILTNGYDWCYFRVEDAPFVVDSLRLEGDGGVTLVLFDGSEEPLDPDSLAIGADGVVYARVRGETLEARFSRHAQTLLGDILTAADPPTVTVKGRHVVLGPRG
jgi:hypothetical protein